MRKDSKGYPDICRETYTPVRPEAQEFMKYIKLTCNALIAVCRKEIDVNKDPELRRLFAMAATRFEEGSAFAVKGFTYEGWDPRESAEAKQAAHGERYNNPGPLEK